MKPRWLVLAQDRHRLLLRRCYELVAKMVTLLGRIKAARADGVVSVDAFPQMMTDEMTDP